MLVGLILWQPRGLLYWFSRMVHRRWNIDMSPVAQERQLTG
jgi:hypothetical protein